MNKISSGIFIGSIMFQMTEETSLTFIQLNKYILNDITTTNAKHGFRFFLFSMLFHFNRSLKNFNKMSDEISTKFKRVCSVWLQLDALIAADRSSRGKVQHLRKFQGFLLHHNQYPKQRFQPGSSA